MAQKRRWITANTVTLARIVFLPLPCFLLLSGDQLSLWIAFALFAILGMTDFVDGVLARRDGPTRLGSLIDPVADKMFVVAVLLPLDFIGVIPGWAVCSILLREFGVTALRTSVQLRHHSIQTSQISKLKTVFQMGGLGTIFLTVGLEKNVLIGVMLAFSMPFLLGWLFCLFKKYVPPHYAFPVAMAFIYVAALRFLGTKELAILGQVGCIVLLTWVSALDYVVGCFGIFRKAGIHRADFLRLVWSLLIGGSLVLSVSAYPQLFLVVLMALGFELILGGIDNIVSSQQDQIGSRAIVVSILNALFFLICILFQRLEWIWILPMVSLVNAAVTFWKYKEHFKGRSDARILN